LTFDDGFLDFYTTALPILQQHDATASLFIPTRYLSGTSLWLESLGERQRPLISRAQLVEIANTGVDCGAHTHSHCHLDTVGQTQGRRELTQSKEILEQIIGKPVTTFAYPYGHHHAQARQWVMDAGFQAACAVRNAISHTDDDLFALARITITDRTDVPKLAALLKDLPPASAGEKPITKLYRLFRKVFAKSQ
jgi:peptidoglycan/xylan/chitin deacetylase (PgdA/CDA1 family)